MSPNKYGFITDHKNILQYWNYEKNSHLDPGRIGIKSHKRADWKCKFGHEWSTRIVNFLGCPYCKNKKVWRGYNDLETLFPEIALELNEEIFKANKILFNSMKIVNWRCSEGHNYKMSVSKRTSGRNCPYCSSQLLLSGFNDLESRRPELLEYWDYKKNTLSPHEILSKASKIVDWKCQTCGHEWRESPHSLQRKNICKNCKYTVISHLEKDLVIYIKNIYGGVIEENSRNIITPKELDIYLPELNKAIEFNGDYYHSNNFIKKSCCGSAMEKHSIKLKLCGEVGVELAFVWEHDWLFHSEDLLMELKEWLGGKLLMGDSFFLNRIVSVLDEPCRRCG